MMNPLQMIRMLRGAKNPMQMIMGLARQNPQLDQVMQMVNGKTPDQMREFATEAARQRGLDISNIARQLGIKIPD